MLKDFLKREVKPALGCTEPVAVALAVVNAREALGYQGRIPHDDVVSLDVRLSLNVYKNGDQVGIPGTGGMKGNLFAAALALCMGDSVDDLEVFTDVDEQSVLEATEIMDRNLINLSFEPDRAGVHIWATLKTKEHEASAVIEDHHSNVVSVTVDGEEMRLSSQESGKDGEDSTDTAIASLQHILELADSMDDEDFAYVWKGIEMNMAMAEYGMQHDVGLGVGRSILSGHDPGEGHSLAEKIKAYSAAASDARMHGVAMPVMSSAGSGNHGIVAILPVAIYGMEKGFEKKQIAHAVLISHLACSLIKQRLGRLSPVCGCSIASGAGAAAGIAFLETKSLEKMANAMNMVLSNLAGMLCDGAKDSCSFKVGTGAEEAVRAARLAVHGKGLGAQGIVAEDVAGTIMNLERLNAEAFGDLDRVLVDILNAR